MGHSVVILVCAMASWIFGVESREHVRGHSQWEAMLQCNAICHWVGAYTKWSLWLIVLARIPLFSMLFWLRCSPYTMPFRYRIKYPRLIGGAFQIKPREYRMVNGFSNQFIGWGGEDDNFSDRYYSMRMPRMTVRFPLQRAIQLQLWYFCAFMWTSCWANCLVAVTFICLLSVKTCRV